MTAETTQTPEKTTDEKVDIRNLQDKFHGLLDQRNELNDLSRAAREARDLLNNQRREKAKEIDEQKAARDRYNAQMKEHKDLRNAYQDQAKALIAERKGKSGDVARSLPLQVRKLKQEVEEMAKRQETTVLTRDKERVLMETLAAKVRELRELQAKLDEQKLLSTDISDTDAAIDDLFAKADEEHEKVVDLQKKANEHHDKFVAAVKEVRQVAAEADTKHKEFIAIKTKADEVHNKAMELREKVMAVKGERQAEYAARRKEIGDVNQRARQNVNDPKAIEKANANALDELKKGGKISLGF